MIKDLKTQFTWRRLKTSFRGDSSLLSDLEGAGQDKGRQHPLLGLVLHPQIHQVLVLSCCGVRLTFLRLQADWTVCNCAWPPVHSGQVLRDRNSVGNHWIWGQCMQRDMVITFVKHINLPFNPLKNEPIFTKPPFYMVNEKSMQVDQFALCEQPQMGEGELHQLPHSNMVGLTQTWWVAFFQSIHHIFWEGHLLRHGECNLNLILISNLCFHHQFLYASLLILSFSPFNVSYTRYLANDMQFFLTSPIIIFALWKHRTVGLSLLATLLVSLSS